jgi:hypothetical protein
LQLVSLIQTLTVADCTRRNARSISLAAISTGIETAAPRRRMHVLSRPGTPRIAEFAFCDYWISIARNEIWSLRDRRAPRANSDRQNFSGRNLRAFCSTSMHLHTPLLITAATTSPFGLIGAAAQECSGHCGNCNEGHRRLHSLASAC